VYKNLGIVSLQAVVSAANVGVCETSFMQVPV